MEFVRKFCFGHGLYGDVDTVDFVGIQVPDQKVIGDKANVKLCFDVQYMQMAADGKL